MIVTLFETNVNLFHTSLGRVLDACQTLETVTLDMKPARQSYQVNQVKLLDQLRGGCSRQGGCCGQLGGSCGRLGAAMIG